MGEKRRPGIGWGCGGKLVMKPFYLGLASCNLLASMYNQKIGRN